MYSLGRLSRYKSRSASLFLPTPWFPTSSRCSPSAKSCINHSNTAKCCEQKYLKISWHLCLYWFWCTCGTSKNKTSGTFDLDWVWCLVMDVFPIVTVCSSTWQLSPLASAWSTGFTPASKSALSSACLAMLGKNLWDSAWETGVIRLDCFIPCKTCSLNCVVHIFIGVRLHAASHSKQLPCREGTG